MDKKYNHIFFDLDHTLWDFEKNSTEVLSHLYDLHNLMDLADFTKEDFCAKFREVNLNLWQSYNEKRLDRASLRENRFSFVMEALGAKGEQISKKLAEDYLKRCPTMHHVFPFTREVLDYLKNKRGYVLHVITNGFEDVQHIKIKSAGLTDFFDEVITADAAGYQKPDKEIFGYALSKIKCQEDECIMVGDNLEADVVGAKNAQIDQVYFNPSKLPHKETITYEISCLSELQQIL